jgi:hypothetical protein
VNTIKQLINKSVYGTIGYIGSEEDLNLLEQYILYNLPVLKEFKQITVATNYSDIDLFQSNNKKLWTKHFPKCILIDSSINRGPAFGTADLDNIIFDYCKSYNIKWLCKSANDIILQESILDKEIEDADFYYMNGMGYGGMVPYNFDIQQIIEKEFYPQTNFYFINVSKTDYLTNKTYLDETYNYILNIPNYNGKVWEYIKEWSCEELLKQCVNRNNLTKYHLVCQEKYVILLEVIKRNNIHDCSHKNIMVEGICHFQYPNQPILEI